MDTKPTVFDRLATALEHLLTARNGGALQPDQITQVNEAITALKNTQIADEATLTNLTSRVAALETGLETLTSELETDEASDTLASGTTNDTVSIGTVSDTGTTTSTAGTTTTDPAPQQ